MVSSKKMHRNQLEYTLNQGEAGYFPDRMIDEIVIE